MAKLVRQNSDQFIAAIKLIYVYLAPQQTAFIDPLAEFTALALADLIIDRQMEKIKTREEYGSGKKT